jgi:FMN-dependent oxidoreductase (nitrilotriacetate monooxygenase family)
MAAATKNLAFGITASTTYDPPYSHARRFSTVDHYSNGRIAWNIVTSFLDSAARNLGVGVQQMDHDERYEKADEFMEVLYKLWEGSFQDGAVVKDKVNKQYAIADHIRRINHEGKYFTVPGPHMCEPSPQRTPLLFQAGASKAGKEFGAKHAEALFISQQTPEKAKIAVDDFRRLAKEKYGRAPTHIKAIGGVTIVVAATDEEAQVKDEEFFR